MTECCTVWQRVSFDYARFSIGVEYYLGLFSGRSVGYIMASNQMASVCYLCFLLGVDYGNM